MFLDAVEVALLLVEYRRVENIEQFVGFDGVGHDSVAYLRLLRVHAEVQAFQHRLQEVGYALQRVLVVAEHPVVVAVAQYLIAPDALFFQRLVQEQVGIAEDDFGHEVEQHASLRNADVVAVLQCTETRLYIFGHLLVVAVLMLGAFASQCPFYRLWIDAAVAVGDIADKHVAVFERQFQRPLFYGVPPVEYGFRLVESLHLLRQHRQCARGDVWHVVGLEAFLHRVPPFRAAHLPGQEVVEIRVGEHEWAHGVASVFVEQDVQIHVGQVVGPSAVEAVLHTLVADAFFHIGQYGIKVEVFRQFESMKLLRFHEEVECFLRLQAQYVFCCLYHSI